MEITNYLILKSSGRYPYGVIAGPSLDNQDELHGPFEDRIFAQAYADKLRKEYSDYEYAKVVKIETPEV